MAESLYMTQGHMKTDILIGKVKLNLKYIITRTWIN